MSPTIDLRPIADDDLDFLRRLYAGTRAEELEPVPWSDEQKAAFLDSQFEAQHGYYQGHFPDARFDVVLVDGEPAGRLYVDRRDDEIRLIDIALTPEHRGRGIGGRLMSDILDEAQRLCLPVQIHVEKNNRALALYRRLGFVSTEDQGVYWLMRWEPAAR